ncbi:MAG: bifunctional hydroxymethylpyrimidine kinase/phosphomethylpyrimidine kinase [Rickettsiales bacterium]
MHGRVLIIAGSDSGGGAGIQGDIKTVSALGGYAMTAITAITAQNTLGVFGIHAVPEAFIAQQITLCVDDIGVDALKTGMLHSAAVIEAVVQSIPRGVPLVVDTVMVAKGGSPLLEVEALMALKTKLIPLATIITPNLPEAELLLGRKIPEDGMVEAAQALLALGAQAVLLKGGHGTDLTLTDVLVARGAAPLIFTAARVDTRHTHGTGCAFASAIAHGLARGLAIGESVSLAHAYVQAAIGRAPGFGAGHGPLGH